VGKGLLQPAAATAAPAGGLQEHATAGTSTHTPQQLSVPEQTHQQILGAALQQMMQGPTQQLTGENPVSNYLVLGAILDPKVKAKVWEGKYIELSSLGDQKEPAVSVAINQDDSLISLTPSKVPPPANVYQWLRLFATYAAVYTERFPAQAPSMFTYAIRILDLHHQYRGTAWHTYDENFRRVRAHCPTMPWHTVNWDMAMSSVHIPTTFQQTQKTATAAKQPFRGQPTGRPQAGQAGQAAKGKRLTSRGHCFRFDQRGACTHTDCRFKHTCTICGKGHSRQKCSEQPKNKSSTDSSQAAGSK
jgi:hypothetical protein